ncbi:MAG: FliA/WhiG family RNA polymerase sigma factor [Planctomycetota bacterium]
MAATSYASRSHSRSHARFVSRDLNYEYQDLEARPTVELWREYAEEPTKRLRNYFMEKYIHLVRYNAERIHTKLPDEVDIEDLMSAGLFGLMDAIDAFDLERGVKFETYCASRIKGAILDELRSMDWVPRLVRYRTARLEEAKQKFLMDHGRLPTDEEVANELNLEGEEFDKYKRDGSPVGTISITRKAFNSDGSKDVREIDLIKDGSQKNPLREAQRRDLKGVLTKGLSRAERLIVVLYYYEEMTMKEIGATLNLSESRVSQMHSSILARLKAQFQHKMREIQTSA